MLCPLLPLKADCHLGRPSANQSFSVLWGRQRKATTNGLQHGVYSYHSKVGKQDRKFSHFSISHLIGTALETGNANSRRLREQRSRYNRSTPRLADPQLSHISEPSQQRRSPSRSPPSLYHPCSPAYPNTHTQLPQAIVVGSITERTHTRYRFGLQADKPRSIFDVNPVKRATNASHRFE